MEEKEIITGYRTDINTLKLGFYAFRIYLNFLDASAEEKKKIIEYFENRKNIWTLLTMKGSFDLDIVLWVNDIFEFNQFWNNTLDKYGNKFSKYTVSILSQVICLKKSYLLLDECEKTEREFYLINCSGDPVAVDNIDYRLLNEIVNNARIPLIELAHKLDCSSQTVNYRIKNLMKLGVILAFRVNEDISKLGLQNYGWDIYLKDHTKRKQIIDYLMTKPNIHDIMDMTVGWSDIMIDINIESINNLTQLMEDVDNKFPSAIRRQDFIMMTKRHKERCLPEMEFK